MKKETEPLRSRKAFMDPGALVHSQPYTNVNTRVKSEGARASNGGSGNNGNGSSGNNGISGKNGSSGSAANGNSRNGISGNNGNGGKRASVDRVDVETISSDEDSHQQGQGNKQIAPKYVACLIFIFISF